MDYILDGCAMTEIEPFGLEGNKSLNIRGYQATMINEVKKDGKVVRYKVGEKYIFLKKHKSLGKAINSFVAFRVLHAVSDPHNARYPNYVLGFEPSAKALYSISEALEGYMPVGSLSRANNPFFSQKSNALDDLGHLYATLFLVGAGDYHAYNVFHDLGRGFFGDVDLDIAFKKYKQKASASDKLGAQHHPLAMRAFNCYDPLASFLIDLVYPGRDSAWHHYYLDAYNPARYNSTSMLSPSALMAGMSAATALGWPELVTSVNSTLRDLHREYTAITGSPLPSVGFESEVYASFMRPRYDFMRYMAKTLGNRSDMTAQDLTDACMKYKENNKKQA